VTCHRPNRTAPPRDSAPHKPDTGARGPVYGLALRSRAGLSASTECSGQPAAGPGWRTVDEVQGSEGDAATQLGDRFATAFARCAVSRSCSANLRGRAPSAGSPSRGASGPAYDRVLAGGQQPVEARPDGGHAADLPVSDLSGGGQQPVRTPRTAARPWLHARPAPLEMGQPLRARSVLSATLTPTSGPWQRSSADGSVCNA
jgi:hypothetical protein